jgi:hypothetical protein
MSTKTKNQIDLAPFCDDDPYGRYSLNAPFFEGGYLVATDGKVLVRLRDREGINAKDRKVPRVAEIMRDIAGALDYHPWPAADAIPACPEVDCENGILELACSGCACGHCEGQPYTKLCSDLACPVEIGGVRIARHYWYKIARLPGVKFCIARKGEMLWLRFDGGDGAIMGLTSDKRKK